MLAIKLHPRKKPYLGKGSYLIPIRTWQSGRIQVGNWLRVLNQKRDNSSKFIRYITLVKIPDDHPVFIGLDWSVRLGGVQFTKLALVDAEIKEKLGLLPPGEKGPILLQCFLRTDIVPGGPMAGYPELILGRRLPSRCIKWTKDIRLLFRKRSARSKHLPEE